MVTLTVITLSGLHCIGNQISLARSNTRLLLIRKLTCDIAEREHVSLSIDFQRLGTEIDSGCWNVMIQMSFTDSMSEKSQ
jgi:hypothetical protein